MVKRNIIKIDKSLCNSCTLCVKACTEGALEMADGFALLSAEEHCDGFGACISECSPGALRIEERDAAPFDEEAARIHREQKEKDEGKAESRKQLNWPFKLNLISPQAPFFDDTNIYLVSDCVPFAAENFHKDILKPEGSLIVSCPKFDSVDKYREKLKTIIEKSNPKSLTVVHMEIPCCQDIYKFIEDTISSSAKKIPLHRIIVGIDGSVKLVY